GVTPSDTTAIVTMQFITIDQGHQTQRVWLGFGLGASELRVQGQLYQNGELIGKGEARTKPGLQPGMAATVTTGALVGPAGVTGAVVVGAAGAGFSEAFLRGVDADATRTADAVAENFRVYYVKRGWLAK